MKLKQYSRGLNPILCFFLVSHGIPFLITGILMFLERSFYLIKPFHAGLIYFGLLSPTFAALFVLYNFYNKKARKNYWYSVIDFKGITWKWYLFILSFPFLIRLLAAIADAVFTVNQFQFILSSKMTIAYAVILIFFGPIPEELGWRGIAFPELQDKYNFIFAVLFIGIMWALWHLPLFFIVGTYQYQLGLFTPLFWNFMLGIIFTSAVYGLIYNKTNNSIFAVILFHYIGNLTGETFAITFNAELISTGLRGILAFLIIVYYIKKKG